MLMSPIYVDVFQYLCSLHRAVLELFQASSFKCLVLRGLEHPQLEGQMPNVRYIWPSGPKCVQQLECQNWEMSNFFGIVLQYHLLKFKMVL